MVRVTQNDWAGCGYRVRALKETSARSRAQFPIGEQRRKTPETSLSMAFTVRSSDASGSGSDGACDSNDTVVFPTRTLAATDALTPSPLPSTAETSAETSVGSHPPTSTPFISGSGLSPSPLASSSSSSRDSEPDAEDVDDSRSRSRGSGIASDISSASNSDEGEHDNLVGRDGNNSVATATYPKNNLSGADYDTCGCARFYARDCRSCLDSVLQNGEAVSRSHPCWQSAFLRRIARSDTVAVADIYLSVCRHSIRALYECHQS